MHYGGEVEKEVQEEQGKPEYDFFFAYAKAAMFLICHNHSCCYMLNRNELITKAPWHVATILAQNMKMFRERMRLLNIDVSGMQQTEFKLPKQ